MRTTLDPELELELVELAAREDARALADGYLAREDARVTRCRECGGWRYAGRPCFTHLPVRRPVRR